tara:strand:+ start:158 stop:340 length:183 start_codon:yes stop_codon:yes gene_type:complete
MKNKCLIKKLGILIILLLLTQGCSELFKNNADNSDQSVSVILSEAEKEALAEFNQVLSSK